MTLEKRRYNVLCLSGGGYRGLYTATLLDSIVKGYGVDNLAKHFDLIIGTSTGGLVATALATGKTPSQVASSFEEFGPQIFKQDSFIERNWKKIQFRPQYNPDAITRAVEGILGPERAQGNIEDIATPLALVAVSTMNRRHRIFYSRPLADKGIDPTPVIDAILATSAAPTYFPEHSIPLDWLIDGGMAANAPVLLGISIMRRKLMLSADKIHVLHLGTAAPADPQSFDHSSREAGLRGWGKRVLNSTRDLVLLTIDAQEQMAEEVAKAWIGDRYVHMDAPVDKRQGEELARLDNASASATKKLKWLAEQTWLHWQESADLRAFFGVRQPMLSPTPCPKMQNPQEAADNVRPLATRLTKVAM